MANQNLSQFTEKLFVADADHTFIWDTANAISKRVSRNSWLNSGTLTSDAPVTISQTWDALAVAFTALKVNATSTNSAAASKLLDLQVGTVSKFSVDKSGIIALPQTGGDASALICGGSVITNAAAYIGIYGIRLDSTSALQWSSSKNLNTLDTILLRDGEADHLAMRRGALGQKFSVYGTYPGAAWERFTITAPTSGNVLLGTYKGTGGIARGLEFQTDGVTRMTLSTAGALSFPWGNTTFSIAAGDSTYGTYLSDTVGGAIATLRGGASNGIKANNYFAIQSGLFGWSNNALNGASSPSSGLDTALSRNAAGVVEINNGTANAYRDLRVRSVIEQPPASITPATNGDLVVEATSNTTLTFKLKGTDGTVRSGTITLSV